MKNGPEECTIGTVSEKRQEQTDQETTVIWRVHTMPDNINDIHDAGTAPYRPAGFHSTSTRADEARAVLAHAAALTIRYPRVYSHCYEVIGMGLAGCVKSLVLFSRSLRHMEHAADTIDGQIDALGTGAAVRRIDFGITTEGRA